MSIQAKILLGRWLKKIGVKDYYGLSDEEKKTYLQMEETLIGRKLTDDDVKAFWESTFQEITDKLTKEDLSDKERDFLIVELRLAKKVKNFLDGPDIQARNARIAIESNLSA
jgi:hypothetical protein